MKRVVVATDVHVPFHDPVALALLQKFTSDFRPDVFVVGGDLIDFYPLSAFDRDPKRRLSLRDELEQAHAYLQDIGLALPRGCRKVFLAGNHEDRLRRYLWRNAPELADLEELDLASLLHLPRMGYEYIPYDDPVGAVGAPGLDLYGILIMHGQFVRKHSGATARAHFERFMCNGVCGHSHRQGSYFHRAWGGESGWWEAGCLCKLEPPYMSSPDWQAGWLAGYIHDEPDNPAPRFELQTAVVHNKKLAWEGRLYRA
jgi:hypothetical protein